MAVLDWFKQAGRRAGGPLKIETQLRALLEAETRSLQSLDIPPPEMNEPLRMSAVGLRLPLFTLPSYVYIPFQRRDRDYLGFFPLISRREVGRVRFTLEETGPHEVVRRFPGIWLNRDPYTVYRNLNWYGAFEDGLPHSIDLRTVLPPTAPLHEAPAFSAAEVYYRLTWRQRFFAAYLEGHTVPFEVDAPNAPRVQCMDLLSVAATVAAKAATPKPPAQPWQTLAVSAPAAGCARFAKLLDGLRRLEGWFAHEAVAHGGVVRFQLGFASQQRAKVEDLIAACLPQVQMAELPDDPGLPPNLYRVAAVPEFPQGSFQRVSPFSFDPAGNLLRSLKGMRPGDTACVQVLFAPLSLDFLGSLWTELKDISHQTFASGKMEELSSKFPGWRMMVKLYSNKRAVLEKIAAEWLLPYETGTRRWLLSEIQPNSSFDRSVETWDVAGPEELAGFVYFPTGLAT